MAQPVSSSSRGNIAVLGSGASAGSSALMRRAPRSRVRPRKLAHAPALMKRFTSTWVEHFATAMAGLGAFQ